MINNFYVEQTQLMLTLLPIVAEETCFALKGGTAINFFVRELPRYSVDIDLTYIQAQPRELALKNLSEATARIAERIQQRFPAMTVVKRYTKQTKRLVKLMVQSGNTQVKIEPNELIRGTIYPVRQQPLVKTAVDQFSAFVTMPVLSTAELYGGKICAALDRQHPRDLFDIKLLLENEGLTKEIRQAFVVYLACHNRPMNELLNPHLLDIKSSYHSDFAGMTVKHTTHDDLVAARSELIKGIQQQLTSSERQFLLSIKSDQPDWSLMPFNNLDQFPAIQWKLFNVRKMDKQKQQDMLDKLRSVLKM